MGSLFGRANHLRAAVDLQQRRAGVKRAADIALPRVSAAKSRRGARGDFVFRHLTFLFGLLVLLILGGVIVALVDGALPALRTFGVSFLYTDTPRPLLLHEYYLPLGGIFPGPSLVLGCKSQRMRFRSFGHACESGHPGPMLKMQPWTPGLRGSDGMIR